jgi:hypothetical protein
MGENEIFDFFGADLFAAVSMRTSSGSSKRTNINMPSAMPKFSCTVTLGINSLVRRRTSGWSRWPPL